MYPRIICGILLLAFFPMIPSDCASGQNSAPATTSLPVQWPPTLDNKNSVTQSLDGRTIEHYVHGPREAWGYPPDANGWTYPPGKETGLQQNHSGFYVVAPKVPRENAPLCVVLHSANRTAYDYLGFECLGRKVEESDDPATAMTNSPDEFYALYLNSTNDEWWGWHQARQSPHFAQGINAPPPAEKRVLDTIEWVVQHYKIDRNRIYLSGVSMGGCGALGIGLPHGDIFAAVRVTVPAGTGFGAYRMGAWDSSPGMDDPEAERIAWVKRPSAPGLPDPPVVVDFSSQTDKWVRDRARSSAGGASRTHCTLVLAWGILRPCGFRHAHRPISALRSCAGFSVVRDSQE